MREGVPDASLERVITISETRSAAQPQGRATPRHAVTIARATTKVFEATDLSAWPR